MKLLSRNPDKPKKNLETTIGKIIYGFLLFMPLLAVAVACGYVIFNKNAYKSYSDNYISEYQEVNENTGIPNNNFELNLQTFLTSNYISTKATLPIITYNSISISNWKEIYPNASITQEQSDSVNKFYLSRGNQNYTTMRLYSNDTLIYEVVGANNNQFNKISIYFYATEFSTTINNSYTGFYILKYKTNSLGNVFYYEMENLENSNLFNWTKQTGTYEVVSNTTTLLGITNTYIPMLLTYWLMISVMYFVYDIALMLIMVVHRKIHELQESI